MRTSIYGLLIVGAVGLWGAGAQAAGFSSGARGTSTAQFLKLGAGARAAAMGEAQTAAASGADALYWNPAALTGVAGQAASFTHTAYLESSILDYGAYARNLGGNKGVLGLSVQYFSAGSITGTDTTGTPTGSFKPADLALTLGYARKLGEYAAGVSLKQVSSKIASTARTYAIDLGVAGAPLLDGRLKTAAAVANLGGKLKFDDKSEPLPVVYRAGASFRIREGWLAAADAVFQNDNKPGLALGTEYRYAVKENTSLAGRLGYNTRTAGDVDGLTGLSFGLGFGLNTYALDYALVPFGDLGITHRVSVSAAF